MIRYHGMCGVAAEVSKLNHMLIPDAGLDAPSIQDDILLD